MRTGISMPILNQSFAKFPELAGLADEAGFDSVWDYEFFRNPFLIHGLCAQSTSRIQHATGIATACSRTPFEMANAAADLDELTGGRKIVGLVVLAGFIPPPSPKLTGAELVAKYVPHLTRIKAGIVMGLLGAALLVPWSAMVSVQISRMERGRRIPVWSIFSFGAGCVNAVAFILPFIFWAGAFYRGNRSPELIRLINDMTWLEFLLFFPAFSMQLFCVAMAGLTQRRGPEVFPRWFLFLNLWMATIGGTGILCIFFSGPFAWNGVIGFYLPVGSYVPFLLITFVQFYRAIRAEKHVYEPPLAAATGPPAIA